MPAVNLQYTRGCFFASPNRARHLTLVAGLNRQRISA